MSDIALETEPTEPGRGGFRAPSVWLVAGGGWIGRGIQVAGQLVVVRILIDALGTAGYGVFAVLASLNAWMLLGDFCIGISLQNHISERRASGAEADDIVLTGTVLALGAAFIMSAAMLLLGPWISALLLDGFAFLTPVQRTLAFYAIAFPGIGTALGGVVYRIWFARHRGYLSNLVPAAGTIIGTSAVWILQHVQSQPEVATATFLYFFPLAILPIIALAAVAASSRRGSRFTPALVRPIMSRALRFWLSGLLAAAVLQVDYIVMSRVLGVIDIVTYNVATKLFLLIFFVYTALLLALWPVCSEAIARQEWDKVTAMVRKYIAIGMAFTLVSGLAVALTRHWIVHLLAPGLDTPIPLLVIGLLTFYTVVRVWTDMYGTVLQSMNDLKTLWATAVVQAVLSGTLQTLGARWFGLPGMIIGLISCYLLTAAWTLPLRTYFHICASRARVGATY
jgi:O-antigen/teichoic acid export membrane protein